MTSADEECGAKAVGAGAEVALAASRSGMGLGEGAALPEDAGSAMSLGAGAVVTAAAWIEGTGVETSLAGAMSTAWAGRGAGVDSSTGVRPALRAASRLAPSATTPMGGRLCPRSSAISAGQSMVSSTRLASTTTGSFSKKLPASAMRLASAALRRSGSALCRTTRIAYRVALLKSRARDSVFILVWDGGRAREKGPFRRRADVGHDNPPGAVSSGLAQGNRGVFRLCHRPGRLPRRPGRASEMQKGARRRPLAEATGISPAPTSRAG